MLQPHRTHRRKRPGQASMAFVSGPALPLARAHRAHLSPRRMPSWRPRTQMASRLAPSDAQRPIVQRAASEDDIATAYAIWNVVADHEGARPIKQDELDLSVSTEHVIARTATGTLLGAARVIYERQNARLDRVCVLPAHRGAGVGRVLVDNLLRLTAHVPGVVYVNALRGSETGFFSILGFQAQGNERVENGALVRTMVYDVPVCAPSAGCVGLHHTSIRVSDIERSLAFYGSIGFYVTEKFLTSGGNRACFVEGLGTRLEFVESPDGKGGLSGVQGIPPSGFDRLVFDVTKACIDLPSYLQHLERQNGGMLKVAGEPAQQVVGSSVVSVATIEDPDGLPIEFIRREAQVPFELQTRINW